jgi:hypothetical protein
MLICPSIKSFAVQSSQGRKESAALIQLQPISSGTAQMKQPILIAAATLVLMGPAFGQGPTPPGIPDASSSTQCWDTLNNVSRDKNQGAGKLPATGDYQGTQSGSNEDKKVQGPGAEPKDETGVTTGTSVAAEQKRSNTVRPAGLPNC